MITDNLDSTINQLDLIDIYKILYSTIEYIFHSNAHEKFTKIDQIILQLSVEQYKSYIMHVYQTTIEATNQNIKIVKILLHIVKLISFCKNTWNYKKHQINISY